MDILVLKIVLRPQFFQLLNYFPYRSPGPSLHELCYFLYVRIQPHVILYKMLYARKPNLQHVSTVVCEGICVPDAARRRHISEYSKKCAASHIAISVVTESLSAMLK